MSLKDSKLAFKKHLQTYDQMHDQPSKKFMAHLGQDHIHSSTVRVSGFPSGDGDWPGSGICQRCSDEGIWINGECVCGCLPCVKRNDWTWGNVIMMMDWTDEESSFVNPVPCNGSRLVGPDDIPTEYTNLEIIVDTLSELWDHVPDWETEDPETVPRWSRFFDMAPERTHMIVCKELNLWQIPETARNLPMEPGQPWVLQQLVPDPNVLEVEEPMDPGDGDDAELDADAAFEPIMLEYQGVPYWINPLNNEVMDTDDNYVIGERTESGSIEFVSEEARDHHEENRDELSYSDDDDDLDGIAVRINDLEPRQLFQDDEDEEVGKRKELCTEAQKLLDGATGEDGVFNEESYRLLSNIMMEIHKM